MNVDAISSEEDDSFQDFCLSVLSPLTKQSPPSERPCFEDFPVPRQACSCRKSKCIKLYCECFSSNKFCSNCTCINCYNKPCHTDFREKVKSKITRSNPGAFTPQTRQFCSCRKSECKKKYCDCYQKNTLCTLYCQCEGCRNN